MRLLDGRFVTGPPHQVLMDKHGAAFLDGADEVTALSDLPISVIQLFTSAGALKTMVENFFNQCVSLCVHRGLALHVSAENHLDTAHIVHHILQLFNGLSSIVTRT